VSLSAQFDRDPDNFGKYTARSLALHAAIVISIGAYAFIQAHLHHNSWGSNESQGAIEATLVSNAPAIPLPQELPPTPSVLATPTPSVAPAPAAEQPKASQQPEPDAVPIPIKQTPPKIEPQKQAAPPPAPQPKPQPRQPTDSRANRYPSPVPTPRDRATYGEAAPQTRSSMSQNQGPSSPVNIQGGNFGSQFPYYVDVIRRTVARNWYQQEVQPGTPPGTKVYLNFSVSRDGAPSNVRIETPSGSPSLDTSCVRAVQRVDTFGPLPAGYNQSSISVEYYCEYSGANR
jgi:periplasmic protein TonB